MYSAHDRFLAEAYRQAHFPKATSLIIPPHKGWKDDEPGLLYRPGAEEILRPYTRCVPIPQYDVAGHLMLTAGYQLTTTIIPCSFVLSGVFSQEDVCMIATTFRKGMGGQFLPHQMGLPIDASHLTTLEKAIESPWMHISSSLFSTRKPEPRQLAEPHAYIDLSDFRSSLMNRMTYDFDATAEKFRLRDRRFDHALDMFCHR